MRLGAVAVAGIACGLLALLLVLVVQAERMLLDTDAFVEATAGTIEDHEARRTLTSLLVTRGMERVACDSAIGSFAVESSIGQRVADRLARELDGVLAGRRASELWRATTRATHERFVRAARTDRPPGDDALLDLQALLDRASRVADLFDEDDIGSEAGSNDACAAAGGGEGIQVLDPGSLRAAGEAARLLHVARWLPSALLGALVVAGLVLLVAAGSVRRVGIGLVAASLTTLGGAVFVRAEALERPSPLTDGIRDLQVREFADAVVAGALEPIVASLAWCMVGAGIVFVLGGLLAVSGGRRGSAPG